MIEFNSRWAFVAIVLVVGIQRLVELRISSRHERLLRAQGALEAGREHYPWIVALHTGLLVSSILEVWIFNRPFLPILALIMAMFMLDATALRYWTIVTLGERWTTRVIYLPGSKVVTQGPFRFLKHPNYLAVMIETVALPMLHTAWLTALAFGVMNALLLRQRIRVEEAALREHTDYSEALP